MKSSASFGRSSRKLGRRLSGRRPFYFLNMASDPGYYFFIPCVPPRATSQQKGATRAGAGIRFYKKDHVKRAENDLISLLSSRAPAVPFEGAIDLWVKLVFPWRKSELRSVIKRYVEYPITTSPDCSNLIKMIEDSMTRLNFWNDDGQNAKLSVSKFWGDDPGIHIHIGTALGIEREAA